MHFGHTFWTILGFFFNRILFLLYEIYLRTKSFFDDHYISEKKQQQQMILYEVADNRLQHPVAKQFFIFIFMS